MTVSDTAVIDFPKANYSQYNYRYRASEKAIEIVHWLQAQGLIANTDFTWYFDISTERILIHFARGFEQYVSYTALKYNNDR